MTNAEAVSRRDAEIILKTAVGDANLTQSLEPESFTVGRSFTNRECPAPLQSDSNSRSCANLASRTAVSRIIENLLSDQVLDAAIEVHRTLGGPGLLESLMDGCRVVNGL